MTFFAKPWLVNGYAISTSGFGGWEKQLYANMQYFTAIKYLKNSQTPSDFDGVLMQNHFFSSLQTPLKSHSWLKSYSSQSVCYFMMPGTSLLLKVLKGSTKKGPSWNCRDNLICKLMSNKAVNKCIKCIITYVHNKQSLFCTKCWPNVLFFIELVNFTFL